MKAEGLETPFIYFFALGLLLIYSHELNYIGATTCFMSLGQSSGN
jgi:hypothetical protein